MNRTVVFASVGLLGAFVGAVPIAGQAVPAAPDQWALVRFLLGTWEPDHFRSILERGSSEYRDPSDNASYTNSAALLSCVTSTIFRDTRLGVRSAG